MPTTRFAPSPTGYLHEGHLIHLLYLLCFAKKYSLDIVCRIEDHDLQRSKPEYIEAIFNDLEWLGIHKYFKNTYLQSDQTARYEQYYLKILQKTYLCDCSRSSLKRSTKGELFYANTCRNKKLDIGSTRIITPKVSYEFMDLILGAQKQKPYLQCGDFAIRDRNHNWNYQYCVSIDDYLDDIDYIIRGEDLLESTGRQIFLKSIFNAKACHYAHHPLLKNIAGEKLSKRQKDFGIIHWREQGHSPEFALNKVLKFWNISREINTLEEAISAISHRIF
jgi:glutamyl-tRNA synthetase/glutamyl-Q tRNA(Asp) synthetase